MEGKVMKTAFILLNLIFIVWRSHALSLSANDVLTADDKTYFCDKLIIGISGAKIYNAAGEITKIPGKSIKSFIKNGQVFVKLPVVSRWNDTIGMAFMQLISSRSGLQLFRYCSNCLRYDPVENAIAPANPVYRYYVFKGGRYLLLLDENNSQAFFDFFNVKVIS
jgi:hypothetical protein